MGAGALAITGNIDFYGKSGFVPAKTKGVRYADDPEVDYFLIKERNPGFLDGISGTYKDPEEYFDRDFTTSFQNTDCIFCSTRLYWIYSLRCSTFDATEE